MKAMTTSTTTSGRRKLSRVLSAARALLVYWGPYFLLGLGAAVFYAPLVGESLCISPPGHESRPVSEIEPDEFVVEGIVRSADPFIPSDQVRITRVWRGPRLPRLDVRTSNPQVGDCGIIRLSLDGPVTFSATHRPDGWAVTGLGYPIETLEDRFGPPAEPQRLLRAPQLAAGWQMLAVIALIGMLNRLPSDPSARPRSRSVTHGLRRGCAVGGALYGSLKLIAVVAEFADIGLADVPIGFAEIATEYLELVQEDGFIATTGQYLSLSIMLTMPMWAGALIGATVGFYLAHAVMPALKRTQSRLAWVGVGAFGGLMSVWLFETTLVFTTWLWLGILVGAGAGWLGGRLAHAYVRSNLRNGGSV